MRPTISISLVFALALSTAAHAADLFLDDVALRDGVTSDIHLRVIDNAHAPCATGQMLMVHGAASTANSLAPVAEAIAARPIQGRPVCSVLIMDLPGHGQSSLPDSLPFGELTLDDYSTAVRGTLDRLADQGVRPWGVVGHSMGGLIWQAVQDDLQAQGTSLREAYGVRHATLLAPALPASVPWGFRDLGGAAGFGPFMVTDPALGDILDIPDAMWPFVVFGTLEGTLAEGALTAEALLSAGMVGPESLAAVGGFFGMEGYPQRDVAPGIFADVHGTRLDIVAFEQDTIITPSDLALLFPYLTGKSPDEPGYLEIAGGHVTHGYPISHPGELLQQFDGAVALP